MSDTTDRLLAMWADHRAEGRRKGFDQRDSWQSAPEWAHMEADEWVRKDLAFQNIIGTRLAYQALLDFQDEEER